MMGNSADPWDLPAHQAGDPAIATSVGMKRAELLLARKLGTTSAAAASREFRAFLHKEVYTNQKSTGGTGFCACATRQMSLKHAGIIALGLSYGKIKKGLASETSPVATKPGQWEYWHFNENVRVGGKPQFSHPDKLHPDAIAQVAGNAAVGTGSSDRLRWKQIDFDEALRFLELGAMVAVGTSTHWLTVVRDPFAGSFVYLDPYAETASTQVTASKSLKTAPSGWGSILEYHALVHD